MINYSSPVTLYAIESNPYLLALDVHYYKRPSLEIEEIDKVEELPINGTEKFLIALKKNRLSSVDSIPGQKVLLYRTYPEWIKHINFNDWQRRSKWWFVYEVSPENQEK